MCANQWFLANQIFKWVDGTHDVAEKERKIETKYEEFFKFHSAQKSWESPNIRIISFFYNNFIRKNNSHFENVIDKIKCP